MLGPIQEAEVETEIEKSCPSRGIDQSGTKDIFMNLETQWTVYRTRFLVRARQLTEPLVFTDILGREQSGRPGDYLVETSEGVKRITSQALFEDIYVPLLQQELEDRGAPGVIARNPMKNAPEIRARATA